MLTSTHQVSRSIDVRVPNGLLMHVICEFERYPEFVSNMLAARIEEQTEDRWRVWFEVVLFRRNLSYTLDLRREDEHRVTWTLVQGDWMSSNSGSWTLIPLDAESTRAIYSIAVTIEGGVPHAMSSLLIDASIPRLLRDFKRRAERLAAL